MDILSVTINGVEYEYIDAIQYEGKNYVALCYNDIITINEYTMEGEEFHFISLDDTMFFKIKELMQL